VFAVAGTPLTPVLTESATSTAREHFDRRAARSLLAATTGACALFAALAVAAPALVAAWTGHELGGAVTALRWLAPGFAAWSIAGIASIAGQALGRPGLEAQAALVGSVAVVGATAIGGATAGGAGAAAGTSLGLVAAALWYLGVLRDPWPALPLRSIAITAGWTVAAATLVALLPWPNPGDRVGDLILATAQVAAFAVTFAGVRWSAVAMGRARNRKFRS
jgi:O-antigen/teichoic acid export membrane protein